MARTTFPSGHPLTQTQWSKDRFLYHMKKNIFVRTGAVTTTQEVNGAIHYVTDLGKKPGNAVRVYLKNPLRSPGVGNTTLFDNTESLYFDYDEVVINTLGNAVEADIPLTWQRTGLVPETEFVDSLLQWIPKRMEILTINGFCGLYNESADIDFLNEVEPSANRIVFGGCALDSATVNTKTTDALMSAEAAASYLCTPDFLRHCLRLTKDYEPGFMPFEREGQDSLMCFLHPLQVKSLRASDDWKDIQKYANVRGSKNPFFTDSLGRIEMLQLYECPELPMRTGAGGTLPAEGFALDTDRTATDDAVASGKSVAAGSIIGKQSMIWTIAQKPQFWYNSADGWSKQGGGGKARMPQVGLDIIGGIKKVQFQEYDNDAGTETAREDYAVLVFHTQVQPD